jgi:hypothetical protein
MRAAFLYSHIHVGKYFYGFCNNGCLLHSRPYCTMGRSHTIPTGPAVRKYAIRNFNN